MNDDPNKNSGAPQPIERSETGWDVFAKAPKVEDFMPPERAKADEVLSSEAADFAEPLGE